MSDSQRAMLEQMIVNVQVYAERFERTLSWEQGWSTEKDHDDAIEKSQKLKDEMAQKLIKYVERLMKGEE